MMHFIDDYCCTIVIAMVIQVSLDHAVSICRMGNFHGTPFLKVMVWRWDTFYDDDDVALQ